MNDDEKLPPLCLTEQEIAARLARDVARSLKWREICELAAETETETGPTERGSVAE